MAALLQDRQRANVTQAAGTSAVLGDILGYDPFSRFFSQHDRELEVLRTERGFDVEIPVAGFKAQDVEMTVKDQIITISGKNKRRAFTRSLLLPDDIDPELIEAKIEDGLLTLSLARHPEAQPRKISIKTE